MRGFPPIQIFLLCLAFILLAVPLSHLTGINTQDKPVLQPALRKAEGVSAWLRLRYAHAPVSLSLKIAGKELISSVGASPLEFKTTLPSPRDGVDVFLAAKWPEGTPDTALTLEVEPDGLDSGSATRWSSSGSLDEVLTLFWK